MYRLILAIAAVAAVCPVFEARAADVKAPVVAAPAAVVRVQDCSVFYDDYAVRGFGWGSGPGSGLGFGRSGRPGAVTTPIRMPDDGVNMKPSVVSVRVAHERPMRQLAAKPDANTPRWWIIAFARALDFRRATYTRTQASTSFHSWKW